MSAKAQFINLLRDQKFHPAWWSVAFHPYFIIRRRLQQGVASRAGTLEGKVMDLGCGSKPYRRYFVAADSYVGVDIEQSGHDHGSSSVDVFYDGRTLPFDGGSFDAVVSFETFEHIFNLPEMLEEIQRVLVPGGTLMATLPFAFPEHEAPYDFGRYTRYGLTALLSGAGFERIEVRPLSTFVEAIGQLISTYLFASLFKQTRVGRLLAQALVNFPLTVVTLGASAILPKDRTIYCNILLMARKPCS